MTTRHLAQLGAGLLVVATTAATPSRQRSAGAPIHVLVYHDMEGLAGQDDWRPFLCGGWITSRVDGVRRPQPQPGRNRIRAIVDGAIA